MGRIENFINCSYSEATGNIPVELQLGKNCTLGIEKYVEYPPGKEDTDWDKVREAVGERLTLRAEKRNRYHKVRIREFEEDQKVLIRIDRTSSKLRKLSAKLSSLYQGPCEVKYTCQHHQRLL